MRNRPLWLVAAGIGVAGLATMALVPGQSARTADHLDPPSRTDPLVDATPDAAADIADIYTFMEGDNVNIILTFGGPAATNLAATYDRDVLYTINISNAAPATTTEIPIQIRFGKGSGANDWGVRVEGIPGSPTIDGPVEQTLTAGAVKVRAGLFDDPFFFDSQGLRESRSTGTIRFDKNRNFFGGKNITAVVLQIPKSQLVGPTGKLEMWTTTGRIGGQI
jgi:hypothetical protein